MWGKVKSYEKATQFPKSTSWDHKIEMKPGFKPKSFKIYLMMPEEDAMTKEFIDNNLAKGYIQPSKSPMATPFFFVNKKGTSKKQPYQNYCYLNNWTVKNAYPLPLISDIMDKVKNAKYFTKMDVRLGYNNLQIHEGDEWKAIFKTKFGLFEPLIMFFGLCNSPAMFQHMMDNIFIVQTMKGWLIIYMDDMLILAETMEELTVHTIEVLQLLRENDLYLKPQKCKFVVTKVNFLGFIIEHGKMTMDPMKLAGIADWPVPSTLRQLRSFLGFGNFYHKFIHHYSDLTHPFNELLQKDQGYDWTPTWQLAFDKLKQRFMEEPVLLLPDQTWPFQIESDASKYASGAVLMQTDINGDWHPCTYMSKSFSPAERNYKVYDRELLAIIRALRDWRHYV